MLAREDGVQYACPPRLVIVLSLEAGPRVYADSVDEWETSRLQDWIRSHEDLAELLDRALSIREEWEQAA
jgi:hypothetical protein